MRWGGSSINIKSSSGSRSCLFRSLRGGYEECEHHRQDHYLPPLQHHDDRLVHRHGELVVELGRLDLDWWMAAKIVQVSRQNFPARFRAETLPPLPYDIPYRGMYRYRSMLLLGSSQAMFH